MDQTRSTQIPARCNPVFSIAGVMPTASEMAWKTAYPNPDPGPASGRHGCQGPSFSMAGAMPGGSQTDWRTAMPDPTRDMLDEHGHVITIAEHEARTELAHRPTVHHALPAYPMSTPRQVA